jgi:hypothetical protein
MKTNKILRKKLLNVFEKRTVDEIPLVSVIQIRPLEFMKGLARFMISRRVRNDSESKG